MPEPRFSALGNTPGSAAERAGDRGVRILLIGLLAQLLLTVTFGIVWGALEPIRVNGLDPLLIVGLVGLVLEAAVGTIAIVEARAARFGTAENLALALGILGIPLGFGLVGLIFIWAYVVMGRAEVLQRSSPSGGPGALRSEGHASPPGPTWPPGATPMLPANPMQAAMPPPPVHAPLCPRCRVATGWVAQYSRYFCYRCREYVP